MKRDWAEISLAALLSGGNPGALEDRARERRVSTEVVWEGFRRALALVDEEHPFDVYEATPPGKIDLRVFDQGDVWVDVLRHPHRIADRDDLTDEYLLNLIDFLHAEADMMSRAYARSREANAPTSATSWLENTRLMGALLSECSRRGIAPRS